MVKQFFFFTCAVMLSSTALAQVIPPSVDPGQIERRFKQPLVPQTSPDVSIPAAPQTGPVPNADKITFVLNDVEIEGSTIFSKTDLAPLYEDLIGKKVSLLDMYAVADKVTTHYRKAGYVLSRAVVPAQKISGGVFRIQVIEGYISNVIIKGDIKNERIFDGFVRKLKADRPLTAAKLERYLLLANDLAGVTASGTLRPGAEPGSSELVIDVNNDVIGGLVSLDNRGTKYLGPYQVTGQVDVNSALGMYEKLTMRSIVAADPDELAFVDATYSQPINSEGTQVQAHVAYSRSNPGSTLEPLDIEGRAVSLDFLVSHPFIRAREQNLTGRAEFAMHNNETDVLNSEFSNDHVRAFRLGGRYDKVDPWAGVNLLDLEASAGVNVFGASDSGPKRSRGNADNDFVKFNAQASRLQPLGHGFAVLTELDSQLSSDALLSSEEFSLGGSYMGRAYDPSEITGDSGAAGKIELQYGDSTNVAYFQEYQLYGFYDLGAVWNNDLLVGEENRQSLASTGLGIRFNATNSFSGLAELTVPLTRDVASEGDDNPRFFFGTTYRF